MNILLTLSYFAHLIATVLWLGGLAVLTVMVFPAARKMISDGNENRQLLLNLLKRFRPIANFSFIVLLGTGMIQMSANDNYEGLLIIDNTWSVAMLLKHIVFLGMLGILLFIQFQIVPRIERAHLLAAKGDQSALDAAVAIENRMSNLLLGLGVVVLLFTAIMTAS